MNTFLSGHGKHNIRYEQRLNGTILEQNQGIKFVLEYEENLLYWVKISKQLKSIVNSHPVILSCDPLFW